MKILVIGGTGLVGSSFISFSKKKKTIIAPSHKDLDVTNKKNVDQFLSRVKPDFVINFSAYINIDEAEKERDNKDSITWKVNVKGVENLVAACKKNSAFLIQISTDAVFPGTKKYPGPYHESSPTAKNYSEINWYGYSKLKAEEKIEKLLKNYAIVRISHPFGNPRSDKDLVVKTIRDIKRGVGLFADQLFTPTFIDDLTNAILQIIAKKHMGIYHVACGEVVSRIEFGRYIAGKLRLKEKLIPASMEDFLIRHVPRTRLGGLLTAETECVLGIKFHSWQEALKKVVKTQDIPYKASKNIA